MIIINEWCQKLLIIFITDCFCALKQTFKCHFCYLCPTAFFLFLISRAKKVSSGKQTPPPPQWSPAVKSPLLNIQHLVCWSPTEAVEGPSSVLRKNCLSLRPRRSDCLSSSDAAMISWRSCSQRGTLHMHGPFMCQSMWLLWVCMTTMISSSIPWTWVLSR